MDELTKRFKNIIKISRHCDNGKCYSIAEAPQFRQYVPEKIHKYGIKIYKLSAWWVEINAGKTRLQ